MYFVRANLLVRLLLDGRSIAGRLMIGIRICKTQRPVWVESSLSIPDQIEAKF